MFDLFATKRYKFPSLDKNFRELSQWNVKLFDEVDSIFSELDTFFDKNKEAYVFPESPKFPPSNVIRQDGNYVIELAVAGFSEKDLKITYVDNLLTVEGGKTEGDEAETTEYIQRGISSRKFVKTFKLPDNSEIDSVDLENGMLTIKVSIPKEDDSVHPVKVIPINVK